MNPQPRTILITGAGSGLGRGMACCLAAAGHRLILSDVKVDAGRQTMAMLGEGAERASAHSLDVTSATEVEALFRTLAQEGIDVVINNAGLQHVAPVAEFPEDRWDLLLDVMLKGTFLIARAALPIMRQRGFGRIINIGSIHSLVASPFKSAYVAAKHGLMGLTRVLALETADANITANTICPAYVRTPLVEAQIRTQAAAHGIPEQEVIDRIMLAPMPKKAFITVEEVTATVEFLMSEAARNITGQMIVIDGGWTAQ